MSFAPRPVAAETEVATRPYGAAMRPYDVGLLVLRLAVGLSLAAHGTQKLFGWFGGRGIQGFGDFLSSAGYPAGTAFAVVTGLCETLGGLSLALGLFTPLAAAVIIGTMLNALAVGWTGFTAKGIFGPEGIELPLLFLLVSAALAFSGPGAYAVDPYLPGLRGHRLRYGVGAVVLGIVVGVVMLVIRD
jgi:putative oxidoreductase